MWKIQSYFNFYDGTWCLWFCNVHAAAYIVSLFALLTAELRLRVVFFALWWFSKFTMSFIYTLNNVYSVVRQYNAFKLHNSKLKQKWILSLKSSAKLDNLHKLYNFFYENTKIKKMHLLIQNYHFNLVFLWLKKRRDILWFMSAWRQMILFPHEL